MDNNEAFEDKYPMPDGVIWFGDAYRRNDGRQTYYQTYWNIWQAAQQQSAGEIAIAVEQLNRLIGKYDELKADNERLREALEIAKISSCSCLTKTHEHECHDKNCRYRIYCEALSASTSQSLQAHDDEVIERCADVCYSSYRETNNLRDLSLADSIMALKANNE